MQRLVVWVFETWTHQLLICVLQTFAGLRPERHTHQVLLISPPIVFEPTCRVTPFRVVVRPVNHTALFVPHILAVEADAIVLL